MTRDELAQVFDDAIKELHSHVDDLPDGATKRRAKRLTSILHRAAEELAELAQDSGMIQPFDGTNKPPP